MSTNKQKGGGSRKIGRNIVTCTIYKNEGRREKNKRLKQRRHLKHMTRMAAKWHSYWKKAEFQADIDYWSSKINHVLRDIDASPWDDIYIKFKEN